MALVLGSAGHIDHGKTSLVRALTGIDCDRLEEEKRRGITIELGFAFLPLPEELQQGSQLGIVDVPGHERFVKNMVAGAAGIDFVMLVIAADEGIMPQTREHLEICTLLGIRHGFVALTKIDMVDDEWLNLVQEDVKAFLQGTFLEDAPMFPVSSLTKQGLEELRAHIFSCVKTLNPQRESSVFRLPVDRIFSMKGHGTVVTGTLLAGGVNIGDDAVFMPDEVETKIRGIQWHGKSTEAAGAGQRCALNVLNVEVDEVQRGAVLAHPGTLFSSQRWMVHIQCLSSSPRALRARTEIHFHHGAREVTARLYFFDRERLEPGQSALTEIRFQEPMVGIYGDRCVLRAYSPLRTVAGGMLVHPIPLPLRRKMKDFDSRFALLNTLHSIEKLDELVLAQLQIAGSHGANFAQLLILTHSNTKKLEKALAALGSKITCFDKEEKRYIHGDALTLLMQECLTQAADFHKRDPLKLGMARGVLCAKLAPKLAHLVIERCIKSGNLVNEGDVLRLKSHSVELGSDDTALREKILTAHKIGGITPPNLKDVLEECKVDAKKATPLVKVLLDEKSLVKVKDGMYYDALALQDIIARVRLWFESHDDLDLAGLKEILGGISRKYLIALLEYFDREKITVRVGDKRQLRGK